MDAGLELHHIQKLQGRVNYAQWSFQVKTYLKGVEGLWPVTGGDLPKPEFEAVIWERGRSIVQITDPHKLILKPHSKLTDDELALKFWYKYDNKAHSAIIFALSADIAGKIASLKSARALWIHLHNLFGTTGYNADSHQTLLKMVHIHINDCDGNIEEYSSRFRRTRDEFKSVWTEDIVLSDKALCALYLSGLRGVARFENFLLKEMQPATRSATLEALVRNSYEEAGLGPYGQGMARNDARAMARNGTQGMARNDIHGMARNDIQGMDRNDIQGMARNDIQGMTRNDIQGMARNDIQGMARMDGQGMARSESRASTNTNHSNTNTNRSNTMRAWNTVANGQAVGQRSNFDEWPTVGRDQPYHQRNNSSDNSSRRYPIRNHENQANDMSGPQNRQRRQPRRNQRQRANVEVTTTPVPAYNARVQKSDEAGLIDDPWYAEGPELNTQPSLPPYGSWLKPDTGEKKSEDLVQGGMTTAEATETESQAPEEEVIDDGW